MALASPSLPPTASPRQWGAFVCNFAASGCRMFLGKRCSEYAGCVCVCFTGGDGVNSCLHSYRGTKAGLFFPVDRVEIQAGTAESRRGRAKAGGGRRCPVSGGESRAAGRLSPSPRLGVLRLLGQNLGMGAMCLRRNGSGWQLVFQRHQMRGPYLHQPRRKPLQVLLMSRGN